MKNKAYHPLKIFLLTILVGSTVFLVFTTFFILITISKVKELDTNLLYKNDTIRIYDNQDNLITTLGSKKSEWISISDISENMINAAGSRLYEHLKEPLKSEITEFAEEVNISLVDENLTSVIADYILTNPEELFKHEQYELKSNLELFDEGMKKLQHLLKYEPVYNEELIPLEKRMEMSSKKINKHFEKADNKLRDKNYHAVEEKK